MPKTVKDDAMPSGTIDVLEQLFLNGPTWDGYIVSKVGRDYLVNAKLANHKNGWAYLTNAGVALATTVDVKNRKNKRWYKKQNTSEA
jgi:hypothetical protein